MLSAETGSSGHFFLTDLDPVLAIKGSRDPLGFQPIWSLFGRKLVGNLTTITTSVSGFTTLILGHFFAQELLRHGKVTDEELIEPFLKFEQIAAYSRYAWRGKTGDAVGRILGIQRVQRRYQDQAGRVWISSDKDGQILSNQKTYGLWGLYSVAARSSGLLHPREVALSEEAEYFVRSSILPRIEKTGAKIATQILGVLTSDAQLFEPDGKDRVIGQLLADLHAERYEDEERKFYMEHLVHGGPSSNDHVQERLWSWIREVNDTESLRQPFGMEELGKIVALCRGTKDPLDESIADSLEKIRRLEQVLGPAGEIFDKMLGQEGQTIDYVADQIRSKWQGAFRYVEPEQFENLLPWIAESGGAEDGKIPSRLKALAIALHDGDYAKSVILLMEQNRSVMERRSGMAWIVEKDGILEVRYKDEVNELSEPEVLPALWRYTYFLNALKTVGATLDSEEVLA
jgi:hypothetical protein